MDWWSSQQTKASGHELFGEIKMEKTLNMFGVRMFGWRKLPIVRGMVDVVAGFGWAIEEIKQHWLAAFWLFISYAVGRLTRLTNGITNGLTASFGGT